MARSAPLSPTFIRDWRKFRRLSLVELAERVGVTHATLSRVETGKSPYSQDLLENLARELGCRPVDLLLRDPAAPAIVTIEPQQLATVIAGAEAIFAAIGRCPREPVSAPVARLMVLHVARRLGLSLATADPRVEDLAQDLRAFAAHAADPQLQRELAESAPRFDEAPPAASTSRRA